MTYDRGSEMACHPELARRLKIDIWLGRPARALAARQQREYQRPSALRLIPRINCLTLEARQFMPKGADLSDASQIWLNDVAALMNNRPRKALGWRRPAKAMADEIPAFKSTVALDA